MTNSNDERLDGPLPEPVLAAMRAIHAPPADERYWDALEARMMARLATAREDGAWWATFERWRVAGLIAAAAALLFAGATLAHQYAAETRATYQAVLATPTVTPVLLVTAEGEIR